MKPKLMMAALGGGFVGAVGSFLALFLLCLYRGFPVAADTLRSLRIPFSGTISFHADGPDIEQIADSDLETLRKQVSAIDASPRAKVIALLANAGPDYSHTLASILAKEGRKVLLVRCDFNSKFSQKDTPGLLQTLRQSSQIPIRKQGDYDLLPSGGYTRFGTETLRSAGFQELLQGLKSSYDQILLFCRAPLTHSECEVLLSACDKAFVTILEEPIETLTPFVRWAYHENRCRLTFLTSQRTL